MTVRGDFADPERTRWCMPGAQETQRVTDRQEMLGNTGIKHTRMLHVWNIYSYIWVIFGVKCREILYTWSIWDIKTSPVHQATLEETTVGEVSDWSKIKDLGHCEPFLWESLHDILRSCQERGRHSLWNDSKLEMTNQIDIFCTWENSIVTPKRLNQLTIIACRWRGNMLQNVSHLGTGKTIKVRPACLVF